MNNATLSFYNTNAEAFASQTFLADMKEARERFCKYLPPHAQLLDFGCGSGRDALAFLQDGYLVDAIDGSAELARLASENTGIPVKCMQFQDFSEVNKYNGIWACASILHLSKEELRPVLQKMKAALKPQGVIYTSFKYGEFEGLRGERYFTDFTENSFREFLQEVQELHIVEEWISQDVRPERADEKWLNVILKKDGDEFQERQ